MIQGEALAVAAELHRLAAQQLTRALDERVAHAERVELPRGALERLEGLLLFLESGVELAGGVYRGAGNRDIDFLGKAITVRSSGGPENCIVDAGGWTHDTLTEDLDLSYRVQLAGWRFVYLPDVIAPAELPEEIVLPSRSVMLAASVAVYCVAVPPSTVGHRRMTRRTSSRGSM